MSPKETIRKKASKSHRFALFSNAAWLITERIIRLVAVFLTTAVLARALGPDIFGLLSFCIAVSLLCMHFSALGLSGLLTKELVKEPASEPIFLGTAFTLRALAGLLGVAISILSIWYLRPSDIFAIAAVSVVSTGLIFRAFDVIDCAYQAKVRSKYMAIARTIALVASSCIKIVLAIYYSNVVVFAMATVSEYIIFAIVSAIIYAHHGGDFIKWRARGRTARELLSKSWPLALSSLGLIIYLKIDQIMLGKMVDNTEVAYYSIASQLSEASWFVPTAIANTIFPSLIFLHANNLDVFHDRLQLGFDILFFLGLVYATLLSLLAEPLITTLYGETYSASSFILTIHVWTAIFIYMRALFSKWILIREVYFFSLITHGIGAIVNIILNIMLIPLYSGVGAAIATLISYAMASYGSLFFHSATRPIAYQMTLAFLMPVRYLLPTVRKKYLLRNER